MCDSQKKTKNVILYCIIAGVVVLLLCIGGCVYCSMSGGHGHGHGHHNTEEQAWGQEGGAAGGYGAGPGYGYGGGAAGGYGGGGAGGYGGGYGY
mmetsp:Transcript_19272/g.48215  ORF Transcript_19272/g.48215 Transcript_19272/m.48215 type:complete len:94 (+) Transcript_19272:2664-2945(+)|eukprot:g4584.t1